MSRTRKAPATSFEVPGSKPAPPDDESSKAGRKTRAHKAPDHSNTEEDTIASPLPKKKPKTKDAPVEDMEVEMPSSDMRNLCGRSQESSPRERLYPADDGAGASSSGRGGDADGGESVGLTQKLLPVI
ncbi:hypothetical protein B0H14DRAFT_2623972 [Mycena olivaceomarginata]|nr:hypothetical protein B0H14DRAFT_2623972 [Mycena olivaceomarginata]